jgi:hypothetical protein
MGARCRRRKRVLCLDAQRIGFVSAGDFSRLRPRSGRRPCTISVSNLFILRVGDVNVQRMEDSSICAFCYQTLRISGVSVLQRSVVGVNAAEVAEFCVTSADPMRNVFGDADVLENPCEPFGAFRYAMLSSNGRSDTSLDTRGPKALKIW